MNLTLRIVSVLLILVGLLWLGQGFGLIRGSAMTGSTFWAIAGFVCLVAGGFMAYRGFFSGSTRRPG